MLSDLGGIVQCDLGGDIYSDEMVTSERRKHNPREESLYEFKVIRYPSNVYLGSTSIVQNL